MKIVVDDKIPYLRPAIDGLADEVVAKPGKDITAADVRDAHILIVRTRTRCDRRLLEGSSVRLVVTATIGYDHLDVDYLRDAGIEWANCPGCNATSVAQYVQNSLYQLSRERGLDIGSSTMGIVGVGHVGSAVMAAALRMGFKRVLLNDPPRAAMAAQLPAGLHWSSLAALQEEADVITFHTPLTGDGPWPTFHLADAAFFGGLLRKPVVINAARGGVVDEQALLSALDQGLVREAVVDTWEGEPSVNRELLTRAFVATPHIAGYSADGKANATRMTLEAVAKFLNVEPLFSIAPPALPAGIVWSDDPVERALQLYDPLADTARLRACPEAFEQQRNNYPLRRESLQIAQSRM